MSNLSDKYGAYYDRGIEEEHKIIDILNNKNIDNVKFIRNKNITGIDVEIYKFNKLIGYLEIEVSEKIWIEDYPVSWKTISYLTRKLCAYDFDNEFFIENEPKKNIDKCIYVKFNKNLTKCHAEHMVVIFKKYAPFLDQSESIDNYNKHYHRITYDEKYIMTTDEFIKRLEKWIINQEPK